MRRRDLNAFTEVIMPESDLSECVLKVAAPLMERIGPAAALDEQRAAIALAVSFWNANVHASKLWEFPQRKELNALKKRMFQAFRAVPTPPR